ncbi:hypothetical protein TI39_contig426g00008 [Zymoseptoria brevis]|uniref:RING-type domain-containing protein n=1 Tax=Zymoseptoria brevis TaxID=1047168 RepID=A0A0F4GMD4_9PEZI|nr:hypothetical protein TI39_contig426g00008 [Zymoseptoria brevis]
MPWRPIVVDLPSSLAELRANGLNPAQHAAFTHWRAHERMVWSNTVIGSNDDPEDFYNPDDHILENVIIDWYVRTRMSQDPEEDEADFEDGSGFYANPLFDSSTTEEEILGSMTVITISATHDHTDPPGHDNIARSHKLALAEMKGICPVCKEAISATRYRTSCAHIACAECMIGWLKYQSSCPDCRKALVHEQAILIQLNESDEPVRSLDPSSDEVKNQSLDQLTEGMMRAGDESQNVSVVCGGATEEIPTGDTLNDQVKSKDGERTDQEGEVGDGHDEDELGLDGE